MRRHQRRGISITYMLTLLPVILVLLAVATQLTARMIRFQGRIQRQLADDAAFVDLTRRIELDAGVAREFVIEGSDSDVLHLSRVEYRITPGCVTRTERAADNTPRDTGTWTFKTVQVRFAGELMPRGPGLVWVLGRSSSSEMQGPAIERSCAFAARLNAGRSS